MYDFGSLLKKLRTEKGYSQAKVANIIHKSKNVISDYENGIAMPTLDTLISLATLYNVSLDYLVGIDKKEAIVIEHLDEEQKNLLKLEVNMFAEQSVKGFISLTDNQSKILTLLVNEFLKISKQ